MSKSKLVLALSVEIVILALATQNPMSAFGETLFSGSRFMRWALSPFILIFAVFMPLLLEDWNATRIVLMAGMELACIALLAGFWLPQHWGIRAFRVLGALVFLAYAAYVIDGVILTKTAPKYESLIGFLVIGLPSLWFALKGRFSLSAPPSQEELEAAIATWREQLLRPDWAFYEKHLQRPVPAALRELFADRELLLGEACPDDLDINCFNPIVEQSLIGPVEGLNHDLVAFATSSCGDAIYLRPGATEANKVYITYHDGGDTEVFAESVDVILAKFRAARR
jgi:hypothetical protein